MAWFLVGLAAVVALGAVVAVAFGAGALWVYGFFALIAACTALGAGLGGDLIMRWSRSRFDRL
jgi:uncharacterized membrane protein